jgi:hypothetical protein
LNSRSNSTLVRKTRCPRCAKQGNDRSGDNLAVYDDGHEYCFACGYRTTTVTTKTMARKLAKKMTLTSDTEPDFSVENYTYKLPSVALRWLDKYGVTEQERIVNRMVYDLDKDLLVLPIYDGDRLVVVNCRYFGDNPDYPKYITKGWKSGHYKLFHQPQSRVYVLTEDYISALKVGRVANAIPLLGAHVSPTLVLSCLGKCDYLRIWLDRDKADEAIRFAGRARQWHPNCATIVTEKDPKDYSTEEINEFILQSTKGVPQL